MSTRYN